MKRQASSIKHQAANPAGWTLAQILEATGGSLVASPRLATPDPRSRIRGVSIDTRTMQAGELYVAIIGKSHNGHQFVPDAFRKGACGAIVSQGIPDSLLQSSIFNLQSSIVPVPRPWLIRVPDTTRALGDIAAYHRRRFNPIVIAVTGSNGKSTTKEMLAAILAQRFHVLKPSSSFNNEIGVPLTVLGLDEQTEAMVIEMEMNVLGGIRRLCEIARPRIGIVTNVADTHLEFLGDRAGVAEEKSELIEFIGNRGTAILNADDPWVMAIGRRFPTRETITFGLTSGADLFATKLRTLTPPPSPSGRGAGGWGCRFRLNGKLPVVLPVPGLHNVSNALAALAAAGAAGIHPHEAVRGLANFRPLPLRLQVERCQGLTLIADCYNANPQSMAAALQVLEHMGEGRKIAVLADMLELGGVAAQAHRELGRQAGRVAAIVLVMGEFAGNVVAGARQSGLSPSRAIAVNSPKRLVQKLVDIAQPGDTILVKGSRANRLEEVVRELKEHYCGKGDSPSLR